MGTLGRLGRMAKTHWEANLPKMVAEMKAAGTYHKALRQAEEEAHAERRRICLETEANGADPLQAWQAAEEMAIRDVILLPPEDGRDLE